MSDWDEENCEVSRPSSAAQFDDHSSRRPVFGRGRGRNRDEGGFGNGYRSDNSRGGWGRSRGGRNDGDNWRNREPARKPRGFTSNSRTEVINVDAGSVGRIIGNKY